MSNTTFQLKHDETVTDLTANRMLAWNLNAGGTQKYNSSREKILAFRGSKEFIFSKRLKILSSIMAVIPKRKLIS